MVMRKKGLLLSILLVFSMFVSPLVTSAKTSYEYFGATARNMETNTIGSNTIAITANSSKKAVVYLGIKVDGITPAKTFKATINMEKSTFKFEENGCTANTGWEVVSCKQDATNASLVHVEFKNTDGTGITSSAELRDTYVGRVSFDASEATVGETCNMVLKPVETTETPNNGKCTISNGKYYCDVNTECTKEEYDKQCPTSTDNPQTGSFLPYAVIIGGGIVAAGLYFITKKNKIYHI